MDRDSPWLAQRLLLWFACPDRSYLQRIILVAFSTWHDNTGNCKKVRQKMHSRAYSIQHSHLAKMNSSPVSAGIELFVLIGRRCPSLRPADRSLLAGGDSCCCCCIRVSREVCLNGVISSPICALRFCPLLLPKHRQFERASGNV